MVDPTAAAEIVTSLDALVVTGRKFGTLYIDPPWQYENNASRGAAKNHYDTMSVDEICALPVDRLASHDAHLYLWTTNAFLFDSLKILESWNFQFLGTMIWCKPNLGCGNYWRNSHEILLVCSRPEAEPPAEELPGCLWVKRGRHSEKPYQFRTMIEAYSPGPYLELFGRTPARGWTVFGNQFENSLLFPELL